jgi:hypothetical protein
VSVIIGAVFVVCVMTFRRGFVGETQAYFARRAGRRALPQSAAQRRMQ